MRWQIIGVLVLFFQAFVVSAAEPSWDLYAELLTDYVQTSSHHDTTLNWVNYSQLKNDPDFSLLVQQIEKFSSEDLKTKEEKLAFYINTYNILTLKMVVDNWPLKSIKDAGGFFTSVWEKNAGKIGGTIVTLNDIEHEILRPMGEPRIHMAIVCASISCPDLRTEPYTAEKLNEQLTDQTRLFLSNSQKGLKIMGNRATTSKIFDWFEEDFLIGYEGVEDFIRQYSELHSDINLRTNLSYDWKLNGE